MRRLLALAAAAVTASSAAAQQPAPVVDSVPLASITAGEFFTCGLDEAGRAYCWGANYYGQLGTSETDTTCAAIGIVRASCAVRPTAVAGDLRFLEIDAGGRHVCGIATDSLAYCWGSNGSGQLGTADSLDACVVEADPRFGSVPYAPGPCSRRPVRVNSALRFGQIAAGEELSCGLASADRTVWCWGTRGGAAVTRVAELDGARAIDAWYELCGVLRDAVVRCIQWRSPHATPALLSPPTASDRTLPGFVQRLSAEAHRCAIVAAAGYCWGWNADGQLGIGRSSDRQTIDTPTRVAGTLAFQRLEAGGSATCGITTDAELYCWGQVRGISQPNRCSMGGEFGSSNRCALRPVPVMRGTRFREVALGRMHACALTAATSVPHCWGLDMMGELGGGAVRGVEPTAGEVLGELLRLHGFPVAWLLILAGALALVALAVRRRRRASDARYR